jgi:Fe-S cluster assembly ATP-binding protein
MLVTQEFTVKVNDDIILDNINLEFGPGIHIIMGPNGVGKSTFAHALMGNPKYQTDGAVEFYGKDLLAMETWERSRAGMFMSFQNPTPISGLSNFQFVKQCLDANDSTISLTEKLKDFRNHTNNLRLTEDWDKKQLNVEASGGEKKKNELIQMLMLNPKCVILDEPDSGLDVDALQTLTKTIEDFAKEDKIVIIISHYENLIKNLNVDSVTVLGKDKTVRGEVELAYSVLEEGFSIIE